MVGHAGAGCPQNRLLGVSGAQQRKVAKMAHRKLRIRPHQCLQKGQQPFRRQQAQTLHDVRPLRRPRTQTARRMLDRARPRFSTGNGRHFKIFKHWHHCLHHAFDERGRRPVHQGCHYEQGQSARIRSHRQDANSTLRLLLGSGRTARAGLVGSGIGTIETGCNSGRRRTFDASSGR